MTRVSILELRRYLLSGQLARRGCLHTRQTPAASHGISLRRNTGFQRPKCSRLLRTQTERYSTTSAEAAPLPAAQVVPLRKQLKEQAKAQKQSGEKNKKSADSQMVPGWELTVGIEIHAQLNTARKLFSPAATSSNEAPNSHVALFDVAMPGSQPIFQPDTLIPAIRAALALNCNIQHVSRFDRKHYFHWDQPSGYQITQYYEPFARDGYIILYARDGIAPQDGKEVRVGIKQIQMEQDTAKTLAQPGNVHWLDFNRVGVPLIEIITLPEIHYPATAAALVRKIQLLLNAVDACVYGMESGGLRADVNVSVRRMDDPSTKLGTRTEIKNLNSFRAVEDAIIAERNRQIELLGKGGVVEGETRGWSVGISSRETHHLRRKEGEVDYRYMPDPDLGPVVIGEDLVERLKESLGVLPDTELDDLVSQYGLSPKDAVSMMLLDDGGRVQFYYDVVDALEQRLIDDGNAANLQTAEPTPDSKSHRILASNWVLHELGRLTSDRNNNGDGTNELEMTSEGRCRIAVGDLADILFYLHQKRITASVAKDLLFALFRGKLADPDQGYCSITGAIEREGLWFHELSEDEYGELAEQAMVGQEKVLKEFIDYKVYPQGKLMFLVGKMMRMGPGGKVDPKNAEKVMRAKVEEFAGRSKE